MKIRSLAAAVLATLLWSGSYIVNKTAFACGIGPMTLSGLRYTLAGAILAFFIKQEDEKKLPIRLGIFQGILCYLIGQGFQYIGQSLMNPTLSSLLLNSGLVLVVVLADRIRLHEAPGKSLYLKALLLISGMLIYYEAWSGSISTEPKAYLVLTLAAVGAGMNVVLNRIRFLQGYERRSVTVLPMLFGGLMMLSVGLTTEAIPAFNLSLIACIAYLALISGALGFGIWVWSQQTLTAVESGAINNLMIIEIAVLDVLFFNRQLSLWQWLGIFVVFLAINLLQMKKEM